MQESGKEMEVGRDLLRVPYLVKFTSQNLKVPVLHLYLHLQQYKAQANVKGITL